MRRPKPGRLLFVSALTLWLAAAAGLCTGSVSGRFKLGAPYLDMSNRSVKFRLTDAHGRRLAYEQLGRAVDTRQEPEELMAAILHELNRKHCDDEWNADEDCEYHMLFRDLARPNEGVCTDKFLHEAKSVLAQMDSPDDWHVFAPFRQLVNQYLPIKLRFCGYLTRQLYHWFKTQDPDGQKLYMAVRHALNMARAPRADVIKRLKQINWTSSESIRRQFSAVNAARLIGKMGLDEMYGLSTPTRVRVFLNGRCASLLNARNREAFLLLNLMEVYQLEVPDDTETELMNELNRFCQAWRRQEVRETILEPFKLQMSAADLRSVSRRRLSQYFKPGSEEAAGEDEARTRG